MQVTAYKSGAYGLGGGSYGFKISIEDRDKNFSRDWQSVNLKLPNLEKSFSVNIAKKSFWNNTCRELIHKEIGNWFKSTGLVPWERGMPPKFKLVHENENNFRILSK